MSGFVAEPDAITSYGRMVAAHSQYAERAHLYGAQEAHVDDKSIGIGVDVFGVIYGAHYEAQGQVCEAVRRLGFLCRDAGAGVLKAAEHYRTTDVAAAERMDNTYPGTDSRPVPMGPPARGIKEYIDPTGRLTPPSEPPDFEDPGGIVDTITDLLSPGKWIQEVLDAVIGVNPVEKSVEVYTGDWKAVAKAASAFHCLSYFCADTSRNIGDNMALLRDTYWQGHAAAAADSYFSGLATALDSYREGCAKLRDEYGKMATGIAGLTKSGTDAVTDVMDNAFWAALEVAAGTVLSETVIGPALLWSLAAFQCSRIVERWSDATASFEKAKHIAHTFNGVVAIVTADDSFFKGHPLPSAAYSHPAVGE
ncbi:hypothetical protein [Amycolatopsis aidingensis]|uniref:hypothetical protein n=1 Tax=Amycolatopsis aidingensis TaxID=2842453 RepID=UPI001C0CD740|nr:hypothetical protein [Amycolatopsis aidingensis]